MEYGFTRLAERWILPRRFFPLTGRKLGSWTRFWAPGLMRV